MVNFIIKKFNEDCCLVTTGEILCHKKEQHVIETEELVRNPNPISKERQ